MNKSYFAKVIVATAVSVALVAPSVSAQKNDKLSDAEIASVALTANQIDTGHAQVA